MPRPIRFLPQGDHGTLEQKKDVLYKMQDFLADIKTDQEIQVSNPDGLSRGVMTQDKTFDLDNDGKDHQVQVRVGAAEAETVIH